MVLNSKITARHIYKKFSINSKYATKNGLLDMKHLFNHKAKTAELRKGEFWSLRDLSMDLYEGEIIGIIGKNGSGKSTLARILAGIYIPESGTLEVKGKVINLHATISGMHPFLSGYDNIYIKASLLGLSKQRLAEKISDIIEFSELGDSIDRPFGTYSLGMRIRLAFSIITAVDKDILILDESLSISDHTFNQKAKSYLHSIRAQTSIVYITNILQTMEGLVDRILVMRKGEIIAETTDVSTANELLQ